MRRKKSCWVKDCANKQGSFFEIPCDPKRRQIWLDILARFVDPSKMYLVQPLVCENHFRNEDILKSRSGKNVLSRTAVPHLYLVI
ncbi:hypothetical protein RN001_008253 [Aquatica leii]|uniref:THAP-type domain-containing protein n=1 Tax=Aquatica leii TaxID=1421715 RepID=A0AAN7P9F1_9COLE|nr:hypothetical protein RN001_008253 [Aquatica leii]